MLSLVAWDDRGHDLVLARALHLFQTVDGSLHSSRSSGGELPAATCDGLPARLRPAFEDAAMGASNRVLAAEGAMILGSLQDFIAFDNLPQGRAIASPVFASDADLLGVLCHRSVSGLSVD